MLRHDVQLILAQAWQQILRQNERVDISRLERNAALPATRADKADIELRIVRRERRISREGEERRQRVLELWRTAQHLVRDAGQTDDLRRQPALGVYEGLKVSTISPFLSRTAPISVMASCVTLRPVVSMSKQTISSEKPMS